MTARLTWAQGAAWRAGRHGLQGRRDPDVALDVVARIGGLHAQVMSSAELSLHARIDGLPRDAVPRMLWEERSLYKTWAMRGTLHLMPSRTFLAAVEGVDPDEALREVVRRYLGAHGPATREDLSRWWSALSPAAAGRMLAELGE